MLKELMDAKDGILLFGPKGCGKKLLAKTVASETGAKIITLSMPSTISKFHEKNKYVEHVFSTAKKIASANTFILIDDMCLREFKDEIIISSKFHKKVSLIGCTSNPMELDEALLSIFPGRLVFNFPDAETRAEMLRMILDEKEIKISEDVDLQIWAKVTYGYSYADLKNLCEAAAAVRLAELVHEEDAFSEADLRLVTVQDFKIACDKIDYDKERAGFGGILYNNEGRSGSASIDPKKLKPLH